jgi:hypothetical protein
LITIPSLPDDSDWERMESARRRSVRILFSTVPGCPLWTESGYEVAGLIGCFAGTTEKNPSHFARMIPFCEQLFRPFPIL